MHVALTYSGGNNSIESKEIYLNGVRLGVRAVNSNPLNLTGTENLLIGGDLNSGNVSFEGMVANFRMFNRVLSKDEIYQLYAYQKEYFGLGDLSMTLKAGRLGIGTSEPRAALDVRGFIISNPIAFSAYASSGGDTSEGGVFPANATNYNFGGCYDTSAYRFTAPVNGVYHFEWNSFTNQGATSTSRIFLKKNGNHEVQKGNSIERHGNGLSADVYLDTGDYVTIEGTSSYRLYYYGAAGHNHYSGHLVYATGYYV